MRGGLTVLLVFLICLVILVLYIFLGRSQIVKQIDNLKEEDAALQAQLDDLREKEKAIPRLMERLPMWSRQLAMFEEAIPSQIDDHIFFENLIGETESRGVRILNIESTRGETWLGQITEEMEEELTTLGININAARSVKVAFYSVTMVGTYRETLEVFENLKKHNLLYTIDLVDGPATFAGGTSSETIDPNLTPITFSGNLYYGISEEEVSQETLAKVFSQAITGPAARAIFSGVRSTAMEVTETESVTEAGSESPDQTSDTGDAGKLVVAAVDGVPEGWNR